MIGRGRDLLTPLSGAPLELASAGYRITASPAREIVGLEERPRHARAQELIGIRAGRASRAALNEAMGDIEGTLLFQLLDDFAGASLVADWIWSRWMADWHERARRDTGVKRPAKMVDICIGFAAGASSLLASGDPDTENSSSTAVGELEHPEDRFGWHVMPLQQGPQMRRARRIDLWREGMMLKVDAGFQDSGTTPAGGRVALHEYRVYAEIDADSGTLVSLQAQPLVLPFAECPGASVTATRMIGQKIADFRTAVVATLPSTLGCTHLNDVLRALADVPVLAAQLPAR